VGETQVRFRGRQPTILQNISGSYIDPFAKSDFAAYRTAIAFEYAFYDPQREKRSHPIISAQIGFQRFF
jgi:hypothetical protein